MIREVYKSEENLLKQIITKNKLTVPYMYIDCLNEGFNSKNVRTYVLEDKNKIIAILYDYFFSIQLLKVRKISNINARYLADFFVKNKYKRISGDKNTIKKISLLTKNYKFESGIMMIYKKRSYTNITTIPFKANKDDIDDIAHFLMKSPQFNLSYTYDNLRQQLLNRLVSHNCNIYYIKCGQNILASIGEYGKCDKIVVLGALYTNPHHRNKGYGTSLVNYIIRINLLKKIIPMIYVFNKKIINWYIKIGFKKINNVAKLEYLH